MKSGFFLFVCIATTSLCSFANHHTDEPLLVKPGSWRGVFNTATGEIPFNFEIKGADQSRLTLTLLNAARRDDFTVQRKGADSLLVPMNTYDAALLIKVEAGGLLRGVYKNNIPGNISKPVPFVAEYGKGFRFAQPVSRLSPKTDLSGKWLIKIQGKEAVPDKVAVFKQKGSTLTGVIMQVTGDSGDLEGIVEGNSFQLSTFIGSGPKLYKGIIRPDGSIAGIWSVSNGDTVKYTGTRRDDAALPDAYKLTYLKPGYEKLDFTFPGLDGQPVSLHDPQFKGKVVIIDILGSWCPNCMDETRFLAPWYKKNKERGVEIVGVAFEKKDSLAYAQYTLNKLKTLYDIQYPLLFGGYADTKVVAEKFSALNTFLAFPTTILINKRGRVREIYTGFSGPATGKYYDEFVSTFNKLIDTLVAEPAAP